MVGGRPREVYQGEGWDASCALLDRRLNELSSSKRRQADITGVALATLEGYVKKRTVPSVAQTSKIDRALDRELHRGRSVMEITASFHPSTRASAIDRLASVLKPAGFSVDGHPSGDLVRVVWMHKLREPNLVHGIFTLAAAAALREGIEVRLLLDDTEIPIKKERTRLVNGFSRAVEHWLGATGTPTDGLTIRCYQDIASGSPEMTETIGRLTRFLNGATRASEFLDAAKVLRWDLAHGTQDVTNQKKAGAFATPFWNFLVLEDQVQDLAPGGKRSGQFAMTLGGEDEGPLWRIWHRGALEPLSEITGHLFLQRMPVRSQRPVWSLDPLLWPGERERLARFLQDQCREDKDLLLWLFQAGVVLAGHVGVRPSDADQRRFFSSSSAKLHRNACEDLVSTSRALAEAMMEWYSR